LLLCYTEHKLIISDNIKYLRLSDHLTKMKKISADSIFPVTTTPIPNGILILDENNTITDLINPGLINYSVQDVERFDGFICPGFINTHCHLELSYLKGKIPIRSGLHNFIMAMQKSKINDFDRITEALEIADKEMMDNGIVAAGDISNSNHSFLLKKKSKIAYHTFIEIFGSLPDQAAPIFAKALKLSEEYHELDTVSIVPHSPYSVSKVLFNYIKELAVETNSLLCMHNQENEDENVFFRSGKGAIDERWKLLGLENNTFKTTGHNSLKSVANFLPKRNPILLVHNTVSKDADIAFAKEYFTDPWWCFCPNSNLYIENELPDYKLFLNNETHITIGTDSLASNPSLSILEELKTIQNHLPSVDLNSLLKWGTYNGAAFLRMNNKFGSLEKNKKPGINLINNIDPINLKLTSTSSVSVIA
jgi:cytosine/adenosine deaminase-related metal-dependent hydrolase